MNFYRRRPLALIITICILTSAAAYHLSGVMKLVLIAALGLGAPILTLLLAKLKLKTVCGLSKTPFILICAALTISMILTSYAYYDVRAARYDASFSANVKATVLSVESRSSYDAVYAVRITSRDGERESAKGLLGTASALSLDVGDIIDADVLFCAPEDFYSYREATREELLADGYIFTAKFGENAVVCDSSNGISVRLHQLREILDAKLALYLDNDSALLANALFLGKRDDLGILGRDFSYMGVVHLLALSGLHLSVIGGGFEKLLMRLGVGLRARYVMTAALVIFYVALTGFLASAMRAAIMLLLSYAATFLDTESDRVTSLFIAVGLIVLADPTAIFDVSLQLSFFATLGLLLVSEPAKRLGKSLGGKTKPYFVRGLFRIAAHMAASFGAIMFVLPLQWLYFGEVSLMSVAATLIMSPICELLLVFIPPLLICALLGLHGACGVVGGVIRVLYDLCADTAATLSEHSTLVSLGYPFALPIIFVCAAVIVYMMVRNYPSWLYALIPFAAATVVFLGGVHIYDAVTCDLVSVDVVSGGANDMITLTSRRSGAIIDVGDGSSQGVYPTAKFFLARNLTEIESLVLTHVSRDHISMVRKLLNYRKVRTVLIPSPNNEYEVYIAADITALAREYGSETVFYDNANGAVLTHGDVSISMPPERKLPRSTRPLTAIKFTYGTTEAVYVGASAWEDEQTWEFANGAKYMIFGANGPNVKSAPPDTVVGDTDFVYVTSDELAAAILPWLDGFDGSLIVDDKLSVTVKP